MAHKTTGRKKSRLDCDSKKDDLVKAFVSNSFAEAVAATVIAVKTKRTGLNPRLLVNADTLKVSEDPDGLGHIFELDHVENEPDHVEK